MKRLVDLTESPLNRLVNTVIHTGSDEPSLREVVGDVERELALVLGKGARGYRIGGALFCSNRWDAVQDVGGVEPSHLKRLLDKPVVTEDLVERTIVHTQEQLFNLLRTMRGTHVSRKVLLHALNAHKYHQKVTLLANCVKAFCPDDMPAIIPASILNPEDIKEIIRSLPLDPRKLSDTAFRHMGLAPDDYDTYPLQARLRYKLWSRGAIFALLAEARIFEDDTIKGNKPKNTARIITFRDRGGNWKIGTFLNESSLYIHETGIQHPRKHRKKIMHSYFRVYQDLDTFLASQEHALAGLIRKGEQVGSFQDLMASFRNLSTEEQDELLWEMYEYFSAKTGFHDTTIREFLEKFVGSPVSMQLNILRVLNRLDEDLTGKYREILYVVNALRNASLKRQKKRGTNPTASRK